ncbi:MAG: 16S rRNA (guanine(966)-N(2))-methyltransferase RsmD [Planctomycetes bacterium]|nr:16S rRNA (guanine(966)-N(2))-methyltransferase RsmD [Planctomycetota bacterium]
MNARARPRPERIRIVAGHLRGRMLEVPPGTTVRPMRERIREALFAMLGDRVRGARVLDLFAGSGALACEAMSRGAVRALVVEKNPAVLAILRRNIAELGLEPVAEVRSADAYELKLPVAAVFDLILLDPPFADYADPARDPCALAARLAAGAALAAGGLLAFEHPAEFAPPAPPAPCLSAAARTYGSTALAVWEKPAAAREDGGERGERTT